MNACLVTGLMQQFHRLFGVLVLSLFSLQVMAAETPVVVSVDHRVTATFSKPQFDARKGVYTTKVSIRNRSAASLLSPLRLTIRQFDGKNVKPINAQGVGKDGQPYFEFALPKGVLAAGSVTETVKVFFSVEKNKDIGAAKERVGIKTRLPSSYDYHVSAGVELAPLEPRAEPYALTVDSGKVNVRFSVRVVGNTKTAEAVYLRRIGDGKGIAMNDQGKDGDLVAKDGIYGASIPVDAAKVKPDACLNYEAFINVGRAKVVSSPLEICVSSFPVRVARSDTTKSITFSDGIKAVPDEILVRFAPTTSAATIRDLFANIDAKVVGSLPPENFYQAKLATAVNPERLMALISKLKNHKEVVKAYPNALGGPASTPIDPEFTSQHGLQRVRAHDVWDAGANGNGIVVAVLDTGIDRTHPDFGTVGDCQLVDNDCGSSNTDFDPAGHGTAVAGVIAAKTNNNPPMGLGVAGVAPASKIKSILVGADTTYSLAEIRQSLLDANSYGVAVVVNASLAIGPIPPVDVPLPTLDVGDLCASINTVVLSGGVTPVAIVVNAAGNRGSSGNYYPGRCNDSTNALHGQLTRKDLFITVANSISTLPVDPACAPAAALDERCGSSASPGSNLTASNYGAWVDLAAPGTQIRSTATGGGYASFTGTSLSAPMVSGAVAMLRQCGVPLNQIESELKTGTIPSLPPIVTVPFPDGSSAPRLDIYRALAHLNHAPTGISPATISINEGSPINTLISTLSANDVDTCDKHTYSITGANPGGFTLDANTGELRVGGIGLDYEAVPSHSYTLTVQVADFFGLTSSQLVTVNLNNLNDNPPVITSNGGGASASISIPENSTAVTTVTATDADNLGPLTYTVSGTDATWLNINSSTGVLSFTTPPNFEAATDAGTNNVYDVVVQVTDGTFTDTQTIAVTVTNVNEAPVANNDTLAATQNTAITFTAAQLLSNDTDVDAGTTLTISSVTSGAGGTAVRNGDGTVTFTPNPGFSGPANFTYRATDGSLLSNVATVTVNVSALVPHAPVANNDTLDAMEDTPVTYAAALLVGNDTDADAGTTLSVASVASGAGGTVVLNGDGTVTFTPNTDFNGVANFTYTATDGGLTSNVASVTVNVAPVNDAPTGLPFISGTRTVGQTLTANTLTGTFPNPIFDADVLGAFSYAWQASGSPVGGNSDTYVLAPADFEKFMRVCVSYTDGGGTPENVCSTADTTAVGDPHIFTVDGLRYDFQGAGEFVALRGANGMEIQLRMAPVSSAPPLPDDYTGLTSGASVNTAVAARVGKHRVTYQPDTSTNAVAGTFVLRVDGVVTTLPTGGIDLGDGGRVLPQAGGIQIDFPDQTTLMINNNWGTFYGASWLHINVFHTSAYDGVMGARSKGSWLPRLSDGSAFGAKPAALHDRYVELYMKFADSWRVNKETSLFDYAEGTSTATFTNKAWPTENGPYTTGTEPVATPLPLKAAKLACRDVVGKIENANCIFDVRVLGHAELAKGHVLNQKIRLGATNVVVRRADKLNDRGEMVVTATVARHATVVPQVKGIRTVPAGTVQFMLGDKPLGKPVKLDAKGQAKLAVTRLNLERFNTGKQAITAQYLPIRDKANVFLPGISRQLTREVVKLSPVVHGN